MIDHLNAVYPLESGSGIQHNGRIVPQSREIPARLEPRVSAHELDHMGVKNVACAAAEAKEVGAATGEKVACQMVACQIKRQYIH